VSLRCTGRPFGAGFRHPDDLHRLSWPGRGNPGPAAIDQWLACDIDHHDINPNDETYQDLLSTLLKQAGICQQKMNLHSFFLVGAKRPLPGNKLTVSSYMVLSGKTMTKS